MYINAYICFTEATSWEEVYVKQLINYNMRV